MKTKLTLVLLTALYSLGFGQPTISKLSFRESVPLFGLYEIVFDMDNYDNPYDPAVIDVFAKFVAPDGKTFKVNGFYYEDYTFSKKDGYEKARPNAKNNGWRVRFLSISAFNLCISAAKRSASAANLSRTASDSSQKPTPNT